MSPHSCCPDTNCIAIIRYTIRLGDMTIFSHRPSSAKTSPIDDIFVIKKIANKQWYNALQRIYTPDRRPGAAPGAPPQGEASWERGENERKSRAVAGCYLQVRDVLWACRLSIFGNLQAHIASRTRRVVSLQICHFRGSAGQAQAAVCIAVWCVPQAPISCYTQTKRIVKHFTKLHRRIFF